MLHDFRLFFSFERKFFLFPIIQKVIKTINVDFTDYSHKKYVFAILCVRFVLEFKKEVKES